MRSSLSEENELFVSKQYFNVIEQRSLISTLPKDTIIIPRYSCLPYFKELEEDVNFFGCKLINSFRQHLYVADMKNYYEDLYEITPKTYFRLEDVPRTGGPFIVKGATNSKKFLWNTRCFCKNINEVVETYRALSDDSLIGQQDIYIREYVPLVKLSEGLNELPISEEYRFFVAYKKVISSAFYWASHIDDLNEIPNSNCVPKEFIQKIIDLVDDKINFYVIDIARTINNEWIVIELNDGQQSGLSLNDPHTFYKNLKDIVEEQE